MKRINRITVSIEEAVDLLLKNTNPVSDELLPVSNADRRVLAEDVSAVMDLPPFHRSAYDGFAFCAKDTESASAEHPISFPLDGAIMAGDWREEPVPPGHAVRIMTGAALPEGTDAVINFERVEERDGFVILPFPLSKWENVDQKGDELRQGAPLFCRGEKLTPAHLGVLAAQGIEEVCVYRKPRAAILSTGSELIQSGEVLRPGKIYSSNTQLLSAYLAREGVETTQAWYLPDDEGAITDALRKLSQGNDLVITTGGASVGEKDYAGSALRKSGAEMLFEHAIMKPGSCCYGARREGALIVSLSGNPGAALTAYFRIVLPAVRKLCGRTDVRLKEEVLPLKKGFPKINPYPRVIKGHVESSGGELMFVPHGGQKKGEQTAFIGLNALAELPATKEPFQAGVAVRVFYVDS